MIHKQLHIGFDTKAIKSINNVPYHPLKELKCKLCNINTGGYNAMQCNLFARFNLLPWGGRECEIDFKGTVKQI